MSATTGNRNVGNFNQVHLPEDSKSGTTTSLYNTMAIIMCLSEHLLTAGNISQHTPRIASAAFENTIYSNFLV